MVDEVRDDGGHQCDAENVHKLVEAVDAADIREDQEVRHNRDNVDKCRVNKALVHYDNATHVLDSEDAEDYRDYLEEERDTGKLNRMAETEVDTCDKLQRNVEYSHNRHKSENLSVVEGGSGALLK